MKHTIQENLAKNLHEWYLEACQLPESGMDFNPLAQEPYESLKETQKFLDRYIAGKIIDDFLAPQLQSIKDEIEESWGKEGSFTGSFGFQGELMGISSYQQESDKVRDKVLSIISNRMGNKI